MIEAEQITKKNKLEIFIKNNSNLFYLIVSLMGIVWGIVAIYLTEKSFATTFTATYVLLFVETMIIITLLSIMAFISTARIKPVRILILKVLIWSYEKTIKHRETRYKKHKEELEERNKKKELIK